MQLAEAAPSKVDELLSESTPKTIRTDKAENFFTELQKRARYPETYSQRDDVQALFRDLLKSSRPAESQSQFFDCTNGHGVMAMYIAGTYLIEISLSDKPSETKKQAFRDQFLKYEKYCAEDIAKGKRFFDDLANHLENARDERKKDLELIKRNEINAKEEQVRRNVREKQESLAKEADRTKASEMLRQERKTQLESGKIKPVTMDDVRLMTDATNGVRVVHNPPLRADMHIYWTWGQLIDWDGDKLLIKWGPNFFIVQTNKATVYFGDTQRSLGKNRPIQAVGLLINIADMPNGKMPVFQASHISSP